MRFSILDTRAQLKLECAKKEGQGLLQIMHNSYRWRQVRNEHVAEESCCQMCEIERDLEVHHIAPWHMAPDLRYDRDNLITLCRACHFRFGHYLNWRSSNPRIRELSAFALGMRHDVLSKIAITTQMEFDIGIPGIDQTPAFAYGLRIEV